ncbi:Krr1-domain-containing protein [Dothidotthia symphoricarpi CBS 119687]|uniref:Krr1-domain-containing protein n=1 Tax=Dothidotthia symphoricarpi CBS 119687 TaxID=1392245 RepID=A0A6A6AD17_9PLEO|nr:Krr1-domain-containing protein [Dothidotthia symphoricarpi CBS 119687]KAF2128767.1 Krr1-domain-containing protein [Dothidotthia symphoricarpi CBS 119687]
MARTKEKNGAKRELNDESAHSKTHDKRPAKKAKLLDNTDDEGSDGDAGGVTLKVNEEFARRFEHNNKRAEQHRLEEKYGKGKAPQNGDDDSEDSEEGVEEDDAAELLDEALDDEVTATLQALRSKDPRIYNKDVKFYRDPAEDEGQAEGTEKNESMTLRQYHTKNLLEGKIPGEDEEDAPPQTYAQEQEEVRRNLVKEMHAAADEEDDDFLVAKPKPAASKKDRVKITVEDVEKAEHDPETFLSNFMASRAWVPSGASRFQPLQSDDEEEEAAADEWENSYNLYFENTAGANEKITTYARDVVATTTVRRDDVNGRRKARDAARAKREAERQEKEAGLARLRKLKIDDMEQKVQQIRKIGGLSGRDFQIDEWKEVLEGDWSDERWDAEMQKRFGDAYYDEGDAAAESEDEKIKNKKKPKKPKFDDDIDIKDLVPDFKDDDDEEEEEEEEEKKEPAFTLSSDNEDAADDQEDEADAPAAKSTKKRKQERAEAKSSARRDRRLIENLVDSTLEYEASLAAKAKAPARFRYRETSPTTFGLTARDILLADDKQLNDFAGLKKLAAFRDPEKKKKDKKHLSKKARLRQWRQDTFGDADGPKGGFENLLGEEVAQSGKGEENVVEGDKKKKKRSRKRKAGAVEA